MAHGDARIHDACVHGALQQSTGKMKMFKMNQKAWMTAAALMVLAGCGSASDQPAQAGVQGKSAEVAGAADATARDAQTVAAQTPQTAGAVHGTAEQGAAEVVAAGSVHAGEAANAAARGAAVAARGTEDGAGALPVSGAEGGLQPVAVRGMATMPRSATGVSGAVLAAMLDQSTGSAAGHASETHGVDGVFTRDVTTPALSVRSGLTDYAQPSNATVPPIYNVASRYRSMPGAWRYDQRHQVQNDNRLSDGASRPFTDLWALTYLSQDAEGLAVGNWISVRTMRSMRQGDHYATQFMVPAAGRTESLMLTAPSAFRVRKDAEVPFGKVLQQWQNGPAFAQLILREGSAPDEAALCWNYALPAAGRVFCQHWQVPAQWQAGKPLVDKGAYIDDDREFYPGESGHRFWRWEAASGQGQ